MVKQGKVSTAPAALNGRRDGSGGGREAQEQPIDGQPASQPASKHAMVHGGERLRWTSSFTQIRRPPPDALQHAHHASARRAMPYQRRCKRIQAALRCWRGRASGVQWAVDEVSGVVVQKKTRLFDMDPAVGLAPVAIGDWAEVSICRGAALRVWRLRGSWDSRVTGIPTQQACLRVVAEGPMSRVCPPPGTPSIVAILGEIQIPAHLRSNSPSRRGLRRDTKGLEIHWQPRASDHSFH